MIISEDIISIIRLSLYPGGFECRQRSQEPLSAEVGCRSRIRTFFQMKILADNEAPQKLQWDCHFGGFSPGSHRSSADEWTECAARSAEYVLRFPFGLGVRSLF